MKVLSFIRSLGVWLLLLVFAFSISPRRYWHDLLADHTYASHNVEDKADNVIRMDCHADDVVVHSPFVPELSPLAVSLPVAFNLYTPVCVCSIATMPVIHPTLRGPPSLV